MLRLSRTPGPEVRLFETGREKLWQSISRLRARAGCEGSVPRLPYTGRPPASAAPAVPGAGVMEPPASQPRCHWTLAAWAHNHDTRASMRDPALIPICSQ